MLKPFYQSLVISAIGTCLLITAPNGRCLAQTSTKTGPTFTNEDVIRMVKEGVSVENIVKTIEAAGAVNFDVTPNEIIRLHKARVDDKIIAAMLERVKAERAITPDIQINDQGVIDIKQKPQQPENQAVPSTSNSKKATVRKKSFTFELDACKSSGEAVVCEVMITNNDKEPRKLQFGYDARWSGVSRIVDDQGKEYKWSEPQK